MGTFPSVFEFSIAHCAQSARPLGEAVPALAVDTSTCVSTNACCTAVVVPVVQLFPAPPVITPTSFTVTTVVAFPTLFEPSIAHCAQRARLFGKAVPALAVVPTTGPPASTCSTAVVTTIILPCQALVALTSASVAVATMLAYPATGQPLVALCTDAPAVPAIKAVPTLAPGTTTSPIVNN